MCFKNISCLSKISLVILLVCLFVVCSGSGGGFYNFVKNNVGQIIGGIGLGGGGDIGFGGGIGGGMDGGMIINNFVVGNVVSGVGIVVDGVGNIVSGVVS